MRNGSRNLAFRRDGLRVFILRTVFYDTLGLEKKVQIASCFCRTRIPPLTPYFFDFCTVRNNSPPLWQAAGRQVGRRGVCGCVVVAGGWLVVWCMVCDG